MRILHSTYFNIFDSKTFQKSRTENDNVYAQDIKCLISGYIFTPFGEAQKTNIS